jgi:pyocin large subunit-like protein
MESNLIIQRRCFRQVQVRSEHRKSNNENQITNIEQRTTNNEQRTSKNEHRKTNIEKRTSKNEHRITKYYFNELIHSAIFKASALGTFGNPTIGVG